MKQRLPLIIIGVIAVLYVLMLALSPAPVDWEPDYRNDSANPLGNDVLYEMLPEWLAAADGTPATVRRVDEPPYTVLERGRGDSTYLFISYEFAPDVAETRRLLQHARGGATVFVASTLFAGPLADSLGGYEEMHKQDGPPHKQEAYQSHGLEVEWMGTAESAEDSTLYLDAPGLSRSEGYHFPIFIAGRILRQLDPTRTTVLARRADGRPVVARIQVGRGWFIVSSQPDAFTNVALLGTAESGPTDAPAWVAGILAYLPPGPVLWDEHYKPRSRESLNRLRYVLGQPALKWALGFLLFGVAAYGLFRARRWQRPIPVVEPPPNAAVEFVRTLGRLYFQHGDHTALAERKARYFTDRLRTRLGLSDATLSEATQQRAVRRGVPEDVAADAFGRLRSLQERSAVGPDDLVALDRALDRFFEAAG